MKKTLLFFLIIICATAKAQTKENLISKDSLDRIFGNVIDKNGSATAIMILGKSNKVLYKNEFGYADIENKRKADNHTQFNIASISKSFTALAIMQLVERGKLSVTDTIGKFIPNFPEGNKITIHQLLTHTSGISDSANMAYAVEKAGFQIIPNKEHNFLNSYLKTALDGYLGNDGNLEILKQNPVFYFNPDEKEKWEYSNVGYVALAKVIETVSGENYKTYMRKNVFLPIGMKNTFAFDGTNENEITNYAVSYIPHSSKKLWKAFNLVPGTVGDTNIYTTIDDWTFYEKCLNGEFPQVISQTSLNEIFKKQTIVYPNRKKQSGFYGYGWFIYEYKGLTYINHTGGTMGFYSVRDASASDNLTVVIFSTSQFDKLLNVFWDYAFRNEIVKKID